MPAFHSTATGARSTEIGEPRQPTWGEIHPDLARAHGLLTAYVEREIGERLRGHVDQGWQAAATEYHANRGPDRIDVPPIVAGGSAASDAAWDELDRRERARPSLTEHQQFLRSLLDDSVSLDRAYAAIQERHDTPRPTLQTTIEAILIAVRERGLAALQEPTVRERVNRCDPAARDQINARIDKLRAAGVIK